jgi:hypothetical protein
MGPLGTLGEVVKTLIGRDRFREVALCAIEFGDAFGGEPVAGVGGIGAVVVAASGGVVASMEVEGTALEFEPGVGLHLLGCEFIFGLSVEIVSGCEVAHDVGEVGEASECVPCGLFGDDRLDGGTGSGVVSVLELYV